MFLKIGASVRAVFRTEETDRRFLRRHFDGKQSLFDQDRLGTSIIRKTARMMCRFLQEALSLEGVVTAGGSGSKYNLTEQGLKMHDEADALLQVRKRSGLFYYIESLDL